MHDVISYYRLYFPFFTSPPSKQSSKYFSLCIHQMDYLNDQDSLYQCHIFHVVAADDMQSVHVFQGINLRIFW